MYRRSYYRGRSSKYSNETMCVSVKVESDLTSGTSLTETPLTIVSATDIMGSRKVKNFTLKFTSNLCDDSIIGVLAYVPQGTTMSTPLVTGDVQSLYEPNQNVIATFVIPPSGLRDAESTVGGMSSASTVVSNRLARNLNTGDSIQLMLMTPNGIGGTETAPSIVVGTINYSIKY